MDMVKKRRNICGRLGRCVTLVAFCLVILSSCGNMPANSSSEHNSEPGASDHYEFDASVSLEPGPWAAPLHFYYHGNLYVYHGRIVYSLPTECKFVGQINNAAGGYSGVTLSNADFDGNADGYLYIDAENCEAAYFQWKEWDEAASGKEPYLICVLEETDQQ